MTHGQDYEDDRVRDWITAHRGILTRTAVAFHVTPQYVQQIAYGLSRALPGGDIEMELKRLGWPGHRRMK